MNKQEFSKLSWELLEHKVRYYLFDNPSIDDFTYDQLEVKYIAACKELGYKDTLSKSSGMIGIDLNRPSVQSCIRKLRGDYDK